MAEATLVDVTGASIAVRQEGDGEPLMLLHGFPEDGEAWRRVIRVLNGARFRCLVPDLPGYGASAPLGGLEDYRIDRIADRIAALADRLGLDRFHLVGHDWGSAIGFAVAARHPRRLASFVAIDAPHPDVLVRAMWQDPVQVLRSSYIGFFQLPSLPEHVLSAGGFALLKRSLSRTSRAGAFAAGEIERLAAAWSKHGRLTAMLAYYRALRLPRAPIGRVEVPTTVLWGARDRFVGTKLAAASADRCDRARVHVHPRATHWVHREEPEWVAGHIVRSRDMAERA